MNEPIENGTAIPEPTLSKIKNYAESIGLSQEPLLMAMDVAKFSYNQSRVFVEEIKKVLTENDQTYKDTIERLTAEMESLKNQIKP